MYKSGIHLCLPWSWGRIHLQKFKEKTVMGKTPRNMEEVVKHLENGNKGRLLAL